MAKEMVLINLTPHVLNIIADSNNVLDLKPLGIVARCSQTEEKLYKLNYAGLLINITSQKFGEVTDLPEPKEGTMYVVSRLVAEACKGKRNDLLVPGPLVRDEEGKVIGCNGLSVI